MVTLQTTQARQIAEAARRFQQQRTGHAPHSVTVVLGEDTLVITLYGALSPAEKVLAQSAAGAAQVQEFHRQLFASSSDAFRQEIKRITGVEVEEAAAEIEPATGSVVHAFTTGAMVQVFHFAKHLPMEVRPTPNDAITTTPVDHDAGHPAGSIPHQETEDGCATVGIYPLRKERGTIMSTLSPCNSAVGLFNSHTQAEDAVKELQHDGFDLKKLSIVGRDYHTDEQVVGYYNTGDRMMFWGKQGAFWGGLWGLLFGSAFFFIPGIGPLVVAGPLVSWIVGALEGAAVVGGLSALGAGLYGMGIPKDSILRYETAIKSGKFVLIYHGTPEEVENAKRILDASKASESNVHVVEQPVSV